LLESYWELPHQIIIIIFGEPTNLKTNGLNAIGQTCILNDPVKTFEVWAVWSKDKRGEEEPSANACPNPPSKSDGFDGFQGKEDKDLLP
jgi:hypothetical protein